MGTRIVVTDVDTEIEGAPFVDLIRGLLAQAMPRELRDDRFDDNWVTTARAQSLVAAVELAGSGTNRARAIAAAVGVVADAADASEGSTLTLDLLIEPSNDDAGIAALAALVNDARAACDAQLGRVELWAKPTSATHVAVAEELKLAPYRALHQMRCPLPVTDPSLLTRAFVPGQDDEALVEVNNRAFAHHPVQGTMTVDGFRAEMQSSWFDADGLRLFEVGGVLAGFCWTKIHDGNAPDIPALGEIYVIGVNPDFHGNGYGVPMTASGLEWLSNNGLTIGMLYVEADNEPALRTYDRLGFTTVRTDQAWAG